MKHPAIGPRIFAILTLSLAVYICVQFFSKTKRFGVVHRAADQRLHEKLPVDEMTFPSESPDDCPDNILPSWAFQQSDLDYLIQTPRGSLIEQPEEVTLEPLATWLNGQAPHSRSLSFANIKQKKSLSASTRNGIASDASSQLKVGLSSVTAKPEITTSASEVPDATSTAVPSYSLPAIPPVRTSPWESHDGFKQSTQNWQTVGGPVEPAGWLPMAASTRIKWPDQQLAIDQLPPPRTSVETAESDEKSVANLVGSPLNSSPEVRRSPVPATRERHDKRFVFQPGISAASNRQAP